jgi:hypothetical protein
MLKNIFFGPIMAFLFINAWAQSPIEATLISKSSSEKSLSIDRGDLEDFKEGQHGLIYIQRGDKDRPTLFLIGEGRIVKSFPTKSIWLMEKNYNSGHVVGGEKILVMLDHYEASGRPIRYRQSNVVINQKDYDSVDDFIEKNQNNVPKKFIEHDNEFEESFDIFSEKKISETDVDIKNYDGYKKGGVERVDDELDIELSPKSFEFEKQYIIGDLKREDHRKLLESDGRAFIEKYNNQRFGLTEGLYRKQEKGGPDKTINKKITVSSSYEDAKEKERSKEIIDPKAIAKLKRDGQMWSGDMDDDTLRRYFVTTGLLREKYRRDKAMNELDGHEIMFSYAGNTISHAVSPDVDPSYQMYGYNLNLSYDLHLSRTSFNLKKLSMQFILERGVGYYNVNNINGRSAEGLYGLMLNYYFINNPLTLNQFIWEAGAGIKIGTTTISSDKLAQEYVYQVLDLPALHLLTKYRFHVGDLNEDTLNIGMSAHFGVIYEMKSLRIVNDPVDNVSKTLKANDLKYQFGMSVYF